MTSPKGQSSDVWKWISTILASVLLTAAGMVWRQDSLLRDRPTREEFKENTEALKTLSDLVQSLNREMASRRQLLEDFGITEEERRKMLSRIRTGGDGGAP